MSFDFNKEPKFARTFIVLLFAAIVFAIGYYGLSHSGSQQNKPQIDSNGDIVTLLTTVSETFGWDANAENDIQGYELDWGTASGVYTQRLFTTGTTATVAMLNPGTTYYLAVRAENNAQFWSPFSAELVYTIAATTPSPSPTATATIGATVIPQWSPLPAPSPKPNVSPKPARTPIPRPSVSSGR